jgi:photosystem II stability/assembly factor-like uncharacterized protein
VIGEAGLVAPGLGWAMNGLGFWWTHDGGEHWRTITPPQVREMGDVVARVVDVAATDDEHIWIAAADIRIGQRSERQMAIERTRDGGRTWHWVIPPGCGACAGAYLDFVDSDTGFALAGTNEARHLFRTMNGGASWKLVNADVPFAGPIRFSDARDGWAVSEPAGGGIVYRTRNGGHTWSRVSLPAPTRYRGQPVTAGTPHFFGSRIGVIPVRFRDRSRAQHVVVYATSNGGATWTPRPAPATADLRGESWGFPEALPFSAATPNDWFLIVGPSVYATHDGGRNWSSIRTVAPRPPRTSDVVFTSPTTGWAIFALYETGPRAGSTLAMTTDGGRHWRPLAPR